MTQSHLVIDFPIATPGSAKALAEELPPLMPGFANVQDDLGTVHFSRFMLEGSEKLLFVSDIDGGSDQHIGGLVEHAGPVFDTIFEHVDDAPRVRTNGDRQGVIKWLRDHVRAPADTFFAYEDASVKDIKACARGAGFSGNTSQNTLLTYMSIKSEQELALLQAVEPIRDEAHKAAGSVGTLHFSDFVLFDDNHLGFFTIFDGDFAKYIQDFAEKTSITFDTLFPRIVDAPPTPVAKNAQAFYRWALENNHPPIGFYSAYPGLSVLDIQALLADRPSQTST